MSLAALALAATSFQTTTINLSVDVANQIGTISPYIYGTNSQAWGSYGKGLAFYRFGGNRLSAYNWETNASNAGSDWNHQNDSYLGGGDTPGLATRSRVTAAHAADAGALVTVPMTGHVSADKLGNGDVNQTPDYLNTRFHESLPRKNNTLRITPNLNDGKVYQDEFVYHMRQKYLGATLPIWFSLDNEPDLWFYTHPRITPTKPTYASIMATSKQYGEAIKDTWPNTLVFGPASYGWNGYSTFQDATDANGRFFLDFYLTQFRQMEEAKGRRFLDVLDLHWYPEARGAGKRITQDGTETDLYEARMQAPRSLWDPNYTEDSWIATWGTSGPIKLIPLMKGKINSRYPGTKLAFTEWNYGGGDHISGAIAVADVLGIFGKYGIFASNYWNLKSDEKFAYAGFRMYRNFDLNGGKFGDLALATTNPNRAKVSVYGAKSSTNPNELTIVVINKQLASTKVAVAINNATVSGAQGYRLTGTSANPSSQSVDLVGNTIKVTLPAMSIITYRCTLG
ncbi:MAG TPA: glycoside hydrolase family 44 protein [Fimbriimonas sp.]|nr:glycoside hydrolase family 44 protein [Fimbriimonas sp.]